MARGTITAVTDTLTKDDEPSGKRPDDREHLALAIAWARDPTLVGKVIVLASSRRVLVGRGDARGDDPAPRVFPLRQRPGKNEDRGPIESPFLSRVQLALTAADDEIDVEKLGRRDLIDARGHVAARLAVRPGDVFEVDGELVFVCVRRPERMRRPTPEPKLHPFGNADGLGLVGESPLAWTLREQLAFVAGRSAHVLVLGPSGSGKEVAAQAIHALSSRRGKRLVSRNAATFPTSLIEAELFGNVANYPNQGMPERPGLVGDADGGTLFLDEIGELPEVQTRLLRLLDAGGEYQRLGDARPRKADLRFIGATNRPIEALRADLGARLKLRLTLPGLNERREDIPLLAQHLLRRIAAGDGAIGQRFFDGWDGRAGTPRLEPDLVRQLVSHDYTTNVRELEGLLWHSLASSPGDTLELTDQLVGHVRATEPKVEAAEVTKEQVREALARTNGVRERAWRELGLANRYVLKRLIKKYGLEHIEDLG